MFSGGHWAVKSGKGPYDYIAQGITLGTVASTPFVADFDGDGTPDFAIWDGSHWAVKSGRSPYDYIAEGVALGSAGNTPLVADFDGDGVGGLRRVQRWAMGSEVGEGAIRLCRGGHCAWFTG